MVRESRGSLRVVRRCRARVCVSCTPGCAIFASACPGFPCASESTWVTRVPRGCRKGRPLLTISGTTGYGISSAIDRLCRSCLPFKEARPTVFPSKPTRRWLAPSFPFPGALSPALRRGPFRAQARLFPPYRGVIFVSRAARPSVAWALAARRTFCFLGEHDRKNYSKRWITWLVCR